MSHLVFYYSILIFFTYQLVSLLQLNFLYFSLNFLSSSLLIHIIMNSSVMPHANAKCHITSSLQRCISSRYQSLYYLLRSIDKHISSHLIITYLLLMLVYVCVLTMKYISCRLCRSDTCYFLHYFSVLLFTTSTRFGKTDKVQKHSILNVVYQHSLILILKN